MLRPHVAHCVKAYGEGETPHYAFPPQHHCKTPAWREAEATWSAATQAGNRHEHQVEQWLICRGYYQGPKANERPNYSRDRGESSPTICLIAPLQARLIQDTKDSNWRVISGPEDKTGHQWGPQHWWTQENQSFHSLCSWPVIQGPAFPFWGGESGDVWRLIAEAASLKVILPFYFM